MFRKVLIYVHNVLESRSRELERSWDVKARSLPGGALATARAQVGETKEKSASPTSAGYINALSADIVRCNTVFWGSVKHKNGRLTTFLVGLLKMFINYY